MTAKPRAGATAVVMKIRKIRTTLKLDGKESDLEDFAEAFHLVIMRIYLILVVLRSLVSNSVNDEDGIQRLQFPVSLDLRVDMPDVSTDDEIELRNLILIAR